MRSALIHYIAPSAISVTPNANNSQRDLAVYLARGAKIKVYSPNAGIDTGEDSMYQEWTLEGRNRRLNDPEGKTPFTIFARLNKNGEKKGYLVFAKKDFLGYDKNLQKVWVDSYSSVTAEGTSVLYTENGVEKKKESDDYWYIRLGEVSPLNSSGNRTVTLDTGILDTDQFNREWVLNPDALPLRVELGCTIDGADAGPTPYVDWGKSAMLTANLIEAWNTDAADRVHHWTITRNTGHDEEDALWNYPYKEEEDSGTGQQKKWPTPDTPHLMTGNKIELSHLHVGTDDFEAAPATVFTVTAWERPEKRTDVPEKSELFPTVEAAQNQLITDDSDDDMVFEELSKTTITIYANDIKLKVLINCSIDGNDVGQTPYIPWDKELLLYATLIEGDDTDAGNLVDHWTIERYTGNEELDAGWNNPTDESSVTPVEEETGNDVSGDDSASEEDANDVSGDDSASEEDANVPSAARIMDGGQITLAHQRNGTDDYDASVAAVFTVTAWKVEKKQDVQQEDSENSDIGEQTDGEEQEEETTYAPIAKSIITMFPETMEKYELSLSSTVMAYNPQTKEYVPESVSVRIGVTGQDGNKRNISQDFLVYAGFAASYAPVGADINEGVESIDTDWTPLQFRAEDDVAVATILKTEFYSQQPMNVRLVNGAGVVIDLRTIAFVRDGEDSKEREYIFMRSQTAIDFDDNGNSGLLPSNITNGEVSPAGEAGSLTDDKYEDDWVPHGWWDDAQGVSKNYPYEYESYRDFIHKSDLPDGDDNTDGHWGDFCKPFVCSHYGHDGENSILLTNDNEHEDFLYDGTTLTAPIGGATCNIRLLDGHTDKTQDVSEWRINDTDNDAGGYWKSSVDTNATATISDGVLTVTGLLANSVKIRVRAKYNDRYYYASFTSNKTNLDKYDIILKPNSIAYNPASYSTQTIHVGAEGIGLGGLRLAPTISTSGTPSAYTFYVFYGYVSSDGKIYRPSDPANEGMDMLTSNECTVSASVCAGYVGVYFELRQYSSDSTFRLCDYDTVEISKAENGEYAAIAFATPDKISILCDAYGNVESASNHIVDFTMKLGMQDITGNITSVIPGTLPEGVTVSNRQDTTSSKIIKVGTSATASGIKNGAVFTVTGTYGGKTYNASVTVALIGAVKGENGQDGNGSTGKMCYIAGEYNNSVEYKSNEKETVAVEVTGSGDQVQLWILEADSNVIGNTHVSPVNAQGETVEHNGEVIWRKGLNKYNLIRTKYLFADFASLGRFVVSGSWLFSCCGKMKYKTGNSMAESEYVINEENYSNNFLSTQKPPYMFFKDSDPMGNSSITSDSSTWCFVPNFAVDGLTGKTYQNDAYIRGEVHATSGEFNGIVHAGLMYSATIYVDMATNSKTYTIRPDSEPANLYYTIDPNYTINLPDARTYSGLELKFLCLAGIPNEDSDNYGLKLYAADGINRRSGWGGTWVCSNVVYTIHYRIVTLISANQQWWVVDGEVGGEPERITI